jgi:anti-anti-sigma regulatory factor
LTLRIERARARIRLSGDFRSEHVDQVKAEIELCESPAVLDLEEVDLVDIDGIRFLNECESAGVAVVGCSPYIKEWRLRERGEQDKKK